MKTMAVYFSPTGNTKKSVEAMAQALDAEFQTVDLTAPQRKDGEEVPVQMRFSGADFVIFGMPVYGGRLPALAAERLSGIRGEQTPCVLVVTYGNRHYDDALVELQDLCEAQGFVVKGAAALVGRHTYGEIQVDRQDAADLEADVEFVRRAASGDGLHAAIPGNRPYQKQPMGKGQFAPLTSDACTGCGLCRKSCPAGAIRPDFQVDAEKCISCFRCIRICPAGAKNMDTEAYRSFAQMFTQKLAARRENEYFL